MSETFGALLFDFRTRADLSQFKLASAAGLDDHSSISRFESGKRNPTRATVDALAAALGLTSRERHAFTIAAGFWPGPAPMNGRAAARAAGLGNKWG
jgi:transcriptional regulator with XRE-family HTH domain